MFPQVEELSRKFSGEVQKQVENAEMPDGEQIQDAVGSAADELKDAVKGD